MEMEMDMDMWEASVAGGIPSSKYKMGATDFIRLVNQYNTFTIKLQPAMQFYADVSEFTRRSATRDELCHALRERQQRVQRCLNSELKQAASLIAARPDLLFPHCDGCGGKTEDDHDQSDEHWKDATWSSVMRLSNEPSSQSLVEMITSFTSRPTTTSETATPPLMPRINIPFINQAPNSPPTTVASDSDSDADEVEAHTVPDLPQTSSCQPAVQGGGTRPAKRKRPMEESDGGEDYNTQEEACDRRDGSSVHRCKRIRTSAVGEEIDSNAHNPPPKDLSASTAAIPASPPSESTSPVSSPRNCCPQLQENGDREPFEDRTRGISPSPSGTPALFTEDQKPVLAREVKPDNTVDNTDRHSHPDTKEEG